MFDFLIKIQAFFVSLIPHWTVVVDTETTDRYPESAELLQVSLVSGTGRVLFNKYVKPVFDVEWPDAQRVNHISPRMVKHCREFSAYEPLVNAYLKHTKRIVGYNLSRYDLPILERYGITTSADVIDIMLEDTDKRSKPGERRPSWRKLTAVARNYGYLFIAHDAVEDCLATLHIYCLTHLGINTALYFFRKIVRVIVGALLIGVCCGNTVSVMDNTTQLSNEMAYIAIAAWCYVYGPFTGLLATLIGVSVFAINSIPLVLVSFMVFILGILYGIVRSPKPWIIRIPMCIAFTIVGGLVAFKGVPLLLRNLGIIPITVSEDPIKIVISMVLGIPFYFIMNHFLKRVL